MKKFSVTAIVALGIVSISGAFAGNNKAASRVSSADTIVTDTLQPEKEGIALTDTVVPADTVRSFSIALVDTVVPADTLQPEKEGIALADTVVPADTTQQGAWF